MLEFIVRRTHLAADARSRCGRFFGAPKGLEAAASKIDPRDSGSRYSEISSKGEGLVLRRMSRSETTTPEERVFTFIREFRTRVSSFVAYHSFSAARKTRRRTPSTAKNGCSAAGGETRNTGGTPITDYVQEEPAERRTREDGRRERARESSRESNSVRLSPLASSRDPFEDSLDPMQPLDPRLSRGRGRCQRRVCPRSQFSLSEIGAENTVSMGYRCRVAYKEDPRSGGASVQMIRAYGERSCRGGRDDRCSSCSWHGRRLHTEGAPRRRRPGDATRETGSATGDGTENSQSAQPHELYACSPPLSSRNTPSSCGSLLGDGEGALWRCCMLCGSVS